MTTERKDYLLRMPENLHRELKILSVIENVTMMDFIIEAIKEKLKKETK